jgi:hypothetical protein
MSRCQRYAPQLITLFTLKSLLVNNKNMIDDQVKFLQITPKPSLRTSFYSTRKV